jgi:hypothetical protein
MDDITAGKIKALEDELEALKAHLNKPVPVVKKTGWEIVPVNSTYYIINVTAVSYTTNDGDRVDINRHDVANYFSTKELADRVCFEQELFRQLRRFADENNDSIEWNKATANKFEIYYDYGNERLAYNSLCRHRSQGTVYFSSSDIANKAIETFRDDLLRYFTTNK